MNSCDAPVEASAPLQQATPLHAACGHGCQQLGALGLPLREDESRRCGVAAVRPTRCQGHEDFVDRVIFVPFARDVEDTGGGIRSVQCFGDYAEGVAADAEVGDEAVDDRGVDAGAVDVAGYCGGRLWRWGWGWHGGCWRRATAARRLDGVTAVSCQRSGEGSGEVWGGRATAVAV